jgi:hypothetical protein
MDETMTEYPEKIVLLRAYWESLAGGLAPERDQVDPAAITDLLPYLLLVEFETEPFRVRYRLTGTTVDQMTGMNISGRYLDEFAVGIYADSVYRLQRHYADCHASGQPVIDTYHWPAGEGYNLHVWYGLFPLTVGGKLRQCLSIEDYGELSYDSKIPDWSVPLREK